MDMKVVFVSVSLLQIISLTLTLGYEHENGSYNNGEETLNGADHLINRQTDDFAKPVETGTSTNDEDEKLEDELMKVNRVLDSDQDILFIWNIKVQIRSDVWNPAANV